MTPKSSGLLRNYLSETNTNIVYLALGSNIWPRKQYLLKSIETLAGKYPTRFEVSGCYVTRPYMGVSQPGYFNCCVRFETTESATELLNYIKSLENQLGRIRSGKKWLSRTIDIDIMFFGEELIDLPELMVPHYDVSNRDFFLIPLLELCKSFVNPRSNKTIQEELDKIPLKSRTYPKRIETTRACALNQI